MQELDTTVEPRAPRRELTHQHHQIQDVRLTTAEGAAALRLGHRRRAHRAASRPREHDPPDVRRTTAGRAAPDRLPGRSPDPLTPPTKTSTDAATTDGTATHQRRNHQ